MKRTYILLMALAVIATTSCTQTGQQTETDATQAEQVQREYFQLKIYNFESPDQEAMLDEYFQNAMIPALHRLGITYVGVFKPHEELNERKNFLMVLIPFQSLDQFEKLPDQLMQDAEYVQTAEAYIDAPFDNPPYTRIESNILLAFSSVPKMVLPELNSPRSQRVYELRSYESATEKLYRLKVEMFNEGEIAIFQDLDFNPVFFCEVLSSASMPHLMYMTAHADTTAQRLNWEAFGQHPEWDRMRNLERYQNTVSSITRYLLYPTDYSDY